MDCSYLYEIVVREDNILLGITEKINVDFYVGVVDRELNVLFLYFDNIMGDYRFAKGKINLQTNLLVQTDNSIFYSFNKFDEVISRMANIDLDNTLYELLPNSEDSIMYDDEYEKSIITNFINKMQQSSEFNNLVNLILDIPNNKKKQKQRKI